ncbi:Uncharacterised protein [uncultured Blautia sp.]|nr:Uncharacterised protein [uncultured Blautia sp.]
MKAVSGITPFHVQTKGITPAIRTAHVGVLCGTVLISAHEYDIVMIRILIDQLGSHKFDQHIPVNMTLPNQICEGPPHIGIRRWARKRLRRHIFLFRCRKHLSLMSSQQFLYGFRERHLVVDAEKINRMPAGLRLMVEPLVAADRDTPI